jgi:hypothetical protein
MRMSTAIRLAAITAGAAGTSLLGVAAPAHASATTTPTIVCQQTFNDNEADWDVNSGCYLQNGDHVQITAGGSIWAGVWFTGNNGPQGWNNTAGDPKFPSPTSRAYSLLAEVNGQYRYAGTGTTFTYFGNGSPLYTRINDDSPGNGNGGFSVNVTVSRG